MDKTGEGKTKLSTTFFGTLFFKGFPQVSRLSNSGTFSNVYIHTCVGENVIGVRQRLHQITSIERSKRLNRSIGSDASPITFLSVGHAVATVKQKVYGNLLRIKSLDYGWAIIRPNTYFRCD